MVSRTVMSLVTDSNLKLTLIASVNCNMNSIHIMLSIFEPIESSLLFVFANVSNFKFLGNHYSLVIDNKINNTLNAFWLWGVFLSDFFFLIENEHSPNIYQ